MDLSWLPANEYVVFIANALELMSDEPAGELEKAMFLFTEVGENWRDPTRGKFNRMAKSFHFVLLCEPHEVRVLVERLTRHGGKCSVLGLPLDGRPTRD